MHDVRSGQFQKIKLTVEHFPHYTIRLFAGCSRGDSAQWTFGTFVVSFAMTSLEHEVITLDTLGTTAKSQWHQDILELLGERVEGGRVHPQWLQHCLLVILFGFFADDSGQNESQPSRLSSDRSGRMLVNGVMGLTLQNYRTHTPCPVRSR